MLNRMLIAIAATLCAMTVPTLAGGCHYDDRCGYHRHHFERYHSRSERRPRPVFFFNHVITPGPVYEVRRHRVFQPLVNPSYDSRRYSESDDEQESPISDPTGRQCDASNPEPYRCESATGWCVCRN